MAVPKFINNDMKGGYVGGPATPARRCYVGGGLVFQGFSPASEQEFVQQEATGGPAQVLKVYGKSIVWRQLRSDSATTFTADGVTTSYDASTGLVCVHNNSRTTPYISGSSQLYLTDAAFPALVGHKIAILFSVQDSSIGVVLGVDNIFLGSTILTLTNAYLRLRIDKTYDFVTAHPVGSDYYFYVNFIDLTAYFGEGNEPTTIAEVRKYFPADYYPYDPGSLQSNKTSLLRAERIPVINVWDEEWEVGGINSDTGAKTTETNKIRSKDIQLLPSTIYYCKFPSDAGSIHIYFYDGNGYLSKITNIQNTTFTTPSSFSYAIIAPTSAYGTTSNHGICINLSDPAINGTYYPHWRGSLQLNLSTLTGKLNGEGASVVVYPDGLHGVGTDRDAVYGNTGEVKMGRVDLGSLYWTDFSGVPNAFTAYVPGKAFGLTNFLQSKYTLTTDTVANMPDKAIKGNNSGTPIYVKDTAYNDAASFKAAMSGVMLDYPLDTPLTYTLDTPLPTDLTCEQGDILQRVSDNNCPFVGEMKFGL